MHLPGRRVFLNLVFLLLCFICLLFCSCDRHPFILFPVTNLHITGKVTASGDNTPIVQASVTLLRDSDEAASVQTNALGRYALQYSSSENPHDHHWTLRASADGFIPSTHEVDRDETATQTINFQLSRSE